MVNRWYKITYNFKQHKYRIISILEGIALFIALYFLTKISYSSLCLIYNFFGIKCFGCGMTRAFISILQLDFISAVNYNILSVPLFFGIVTYCIFLLIDILFDRKLVIAAEQFLSKKYMYIIYFCILIISAAINNYH